MNLRSPLYLIALLTLALTPAYAAKTDAEAAIEIEADFADMNRLQGVTSYRGRVKITQGSRRFWSDTMHIYTNKDGEVEKMIAIGKPARFRHHPEGAAGNAFAEAERIEFQATKSKLILKRGAKVWRGNDVLSSSTIVYNTETGQVESGSKARPGAKVRPGNRVRITLQPKK